VATGLDAVQALNEEVNEASGAIDEEVRGHGIEARWDSHIASSGCSNDALLCGLKLG
jgi:hypothetical protein